VERLLHPLDDVVVVPGHHCHVLEMPDGLLPLDAPPLAQFHSLQGLRAALADYVELRWIFASLPPLKQFLLRLVLASFLPIAFAEYHLELPGRPTSFPTVPWQIQLPLVLPESLPSQVEHALDQPLTIQTKYCRVETDSQQYWRQFHLQNPNEL
jgi:hypothetical protein